MEEKAGGKRLAADPKKTAGDGGKRKIVLLVLGAVLVVLLAGYVGLCAAAGNGRLWPNTAYLGVDVSGLTVAQAEQAVGEDLARRWTGKAVALREPGSGVELSLDMEGLMEPADLTGDLNAIAGNYGFFARGGRYLKGLFHKGGETGAALRYTQDGQGRLDEALSQLSQRLGIDGNATTYELTDTHLILRKGVTGSAVDLDAVRNGVTAALIGEGPETVTVPLIQAPPAEPDLEAVREELYAQVSDAYLDRETQEIVPSVTGKDLDVEAARIALGQTAEGKVCQVPLQITDPKVTTEALSASLFRDVLGEATTRVTGTADRKQNVKTAAGFVNGVILFPGDEFSFNQLCSPYTVAHGYGKATAYVNGLSKETVAGGICQASSTLYWATLMANLETVERSAHRYEPSYIKGGLDATVYGDYGDEGSLDFRFKNSGAYPLKIEMSMDEKNYLHVTLRGTNDDGVHGEPYSTNRVVTKPYQTIYQADATVPQGTTRKDPERTGYNAVSIDTYQRLVDADGKKISETKLYTTKYHVRDEIVLFNPGDLELWGIDPYTGIRAEPTETPAGAETPAPVGSESPAPAGSESPAPVESGRPAPVESGSPAPGGEDPVPPPEVPLPPATAAPEPTPVAPPPGGFLTIPQ